MMPSRCSHRILKSFAAILVVMTSIDPQESAVAQSSVIYETPNDSNEFMPVCFDFMPEERYLLLAGSRGRGGRLDRAELRVWDLETGEFILENWLEFQGSIHRIDVADDGETLLVGTMLHDNVLENDNVWLWNMRAWPQREGSPQLRSTVEPIRRLQTANNGVMLPGSPSQIGVQTVLSNDASLVAVRRVDGPLIPFIESIVILSTSGRVAETWEVPSDGRWSNWGGMQFSPGDGQLATTHVRRQFQTPDDTSHTTISIDLNTWDVQTGDLVASRTLVDHETRLNWKTHSGLYESLDYSHDGSLIACDGPEYTVQIVDAESLEPVRQLAGLTSCLRSVEFSSDGSLIAAISNDKGDLCLWNAVTGELLFRNADPAINPEMTTMRFSPDGSRIVTRGYYLIPGDTHTEVRVWDVEQMQHRQVQ